MLEGEQTPCNQTIRRPGGPSVHDSVCNEDGSVCLDEWKEEDIQVFQYSFV